MNKDANNTFSLLRSLVAVVLALAIGFVAGTVNGQGLLVGGEGSQGGKAGISASAGEATSQQPEDTVAQPQLSEDPVETDTFADTGIDVSATGTSSVAPTRGPTVEEGGWYTSKEEVALYIHTYGHLPGNFISKTKARKKGWVASKGNLDKVCPGMSIGGSVYYNNEGKLPYKKGRTWTECDINYHGGYRDAERIVFSNDGLIYYTPDHYKTFEQLY